MAEPLFPIMAFSYRADDEIRQLRRDGCAQVVIALPWSLIAPHEEQARSNHGGQSLKRLAERGGLGPDEAVAVLEDRRYRRMEMAAANNRLMELLAAHTASSIAEAAP